MRLVPPDGFTLYGGATITAFQSADGTLFWCCSARGPDDRFGQYVFRQSGEQSAQQIDVGVYDGRGSLSVADGRNLYLVVWHNGNEAHFVPVPGWQPWTSGAGSPVSAPISIPVPASTSTVDQQARQMAQSAGTTANAALDLANHLDGVVTDVARRADDAYAKATAGGFSEQYVADVAWQKAGDRLALWKDESARYVDKWLFDTIWARVQKHLRHFNLIP